MLDLNTALKKISISELRVRWEEYKQLPAHEQQFLMSYAAIAAVLVGVLMMVLAEIHFHRSETGLSDSDRLGMIILTDQASLK